jgi:hypothetical protein
MKMLLALVCSLVIAAPVRAQSAAGDSAPPAADSTQYSTAEGTRNAPVRIPPPSTKAEKAPAEKSATKKAAPEKEKKKAPEIKGVVVPRGERGFLGVEIVGGAFKITFYDEKKKPKEPDVDRAALRWDAKYKIGQERLVLNPDPDGKSLSNPRTIRPPYHFKLFIVLVKDATEKEQPVNETHVIDFRA